MSLVAAGGARQVPAFTRNTAPTRRIHDPANSNYSQPPQLELKVIHMQTKQGDFSSSMLTIPTYEKIDFLDRVTRPQNTYE